MLKQTQSIKTVNFSVESDNEELEGFLIQIDETVDSFTTYLYKNGCNAKLMILDLPKVLDDDTKLSGKEVLEEISKNLENPTTLLNYLSDYDIINNSISNMDGFFDSDEFEDMEEFDTVEGFDDFDADNIDFDLDE